MVPRMGIEPTLAVLETAALTIKLPRRNLEHLERIELSTEEWKSAILPLNYRCVILKLYYNYSLYTTARFSFSN